MAKNRRKLQGAALRAKVKAQKAFEELQEQQAEQHLQQVYQSQPDDTLFVLDTQGSSRSQSVKKQEDAGHRTASRKRRMELSAKDQLLVDRMRQSHTPEQLQEMAEQAKLAKERQNRTGLRRRPGLNSSSSTGPFDLWSESSASREPSLAVASPTADPDASLPHPAVGGAMLAGIKPTHGTIKAQKISKPAPAVAVDVAKPGQSYRPDPKAHQSLLQTAAQLEVAREQTLKDMRTPLAQGMSAETRALLLEDSSSEEESESEEEDNGESNLGVGPVPKRENKLTRAQRNKQKRLRQEKTAMKLAKRQKLLEKQVHELPKYKKELKQLEKQQPQTKPEPPARLPGKDIELVAVQEDPARAPTVPLALQASSSLRRIQPKGSLVQERLASWQDRKLAPKPTHKRRKKKRKLSVKGARNRDGDAGDVIVMG